MRLNLNTLLFYLLLAIFCSAGTAQESHGSHMVLGFGGAGARSAYPNDSNVDIKPHGVSPSVTLCTSPLNRVMVCGEGMRFWSGGTGEPKPIYTQQDGKVLETSQSLVNTTNNLFLGKVGVSLVSKGLRRHGVNLLVEGAGGAALVRQSTHYQYVALDPAFAEDAARMAAINNAKGPRSMVVPAGGGGMTLLLSTRWVGVSMGVEYLRPLGIVPILRVNFLP